MSVEQKVVIVTGAAQGIGRADCIALARAGARVVVSDLESCDETLAGVAAVGGEGLAVHLDVLDRASIDAAVAATLARFGRIDGLVNNAALYGALHGGRFADIAEAEWDAAMAVNVKGIWNCCRAVVPEMQKLGGGSIVNIASVAGVFGMPYALHYSTSKAAVIGLTRGLARELGRDKIRVNTVSPSAVLTQGTSEFFGERSDSALKDIAAGQALRRNLHSEDVTGAILWLLSDDSRFTTGQNIMVDGGMVML